jgi:hypothetical protein
VDLNIDVMDKEFVVTKDPEPKLDQNGDQRISKTTGLPLWSVQLVVTDDSGGEIIKVNVDQMKAPDVRKGDIVEVVKLVALPWTTNGRSGVAFRADDIRVWEEAEQ